MLGEIVKRSWNEKVKVTYIRMSPELNDVMHTMAAGIQQVIFSPFFPVNFKGFVLVHADNFKR